MILFFRSFFLLFFFSLSAQSSTNFENAKKMILDGLGLSNDPRLKDSKYYLSGEMWLKDNCRAHYIISKSKIKESEWDTIYIALRKDGTWAGGTVLSNLMPIDYKTHSSFEITYDADFDCEEEGCSQSASVTQKVSEKSFKIENVDVSGRRVVECFY